MVPKDLKKIIFYGRDGEVKIDWGEGEIDWGEGVMACRSSDEPSLWNLCGE